MQTWSGCQYSDKGLVRSVNEDSVLDLSAENLWAVADGMGGHEAGDYASQYVVDTLNQYKAHSKPGISLTRVHRLLNTCNDHLVTKAFNEGLGTVGCTVAVLNIGLRNVTCSWSGDSRIYRIRNKQLRQLTRDHNYGSLTDDRDRFVFPDNDGESIDLLTAAIGGAKSIHLEHCWFTLQANDAFLLCTDGLYKEIQDQEIESILNEERDAESAVSRLAAIYKDRGAHDNIGIVYVHVI